MECNKAWEYMMIECDGNMSDEQERTLLLHLSSCKHCSALHASLHDVTDTLPELSIEPPVDLEVRVMRALPALTKNPVQSSITPYIIASSAFILTALVIATAYLVRNGVITLFSVITSFFMGVFQMTQGILSVMRMVLGQTNMQYLGIAILILSVAFLTMMSICITKGIIARSGKSIGGRES